MSEADIPHFVELPFFVNLLILLVLARFLGELFEHFKQPAMMGEILAGIILGPSLFHVTNVTPELHVFSEIAVFLLVIMAGLEIDPREIKKTLIGRKIWIAILGFFIPILSGFAVGLFFELDTMITVFLSLCIAITALPVSVRILMDLGKLKSDIGQKIISVAIFNDVIALMILGIVIDLKSNKEATYSQILWSTGESVVKVLGFLIFVIIIYRLIDRATQKVDFLKNKVDGLLKWLKGKESLFALMFCFILMFSSVSQSAGLHFVVGAFFGAMLITKEVLGEENFHALEKSTSSITMGFLAPIFFATIGLEFQINSINDPLLLIVVIMVSFASKIFGGYLGSRLSGMSHRSAWTIGIGLNARGIMELLIAKIALEAKIIDHSLFSILVIMGILTTFSTPYLLKRSFNRLEQQ
jgi:Kef-type K+ transport system membrane component KefB